MSVAGAASPRRGRQLSEGAFGVMLALPALALFATIVLYPLVRSLAASLFDERLTTPGSSWAGLDNFGDVLADDFWSVLQHTIVFTVGATALPFLVGLALALALNVPLRGRAVLRGLFLFPWIIPSVVTSFLWLWIFNSNYGVLNGVLVSLHLIDDPVSWLSDPSGAMAAIVVAKSWASFPWMMVMLLAALQTVPRELCEAAESDGAGAVARFRHITLPHLRPVIAIVLLLEAIWNLQHFDTIYVLTNGGPAGATTTFAVSVYQTAFQGFDLGRAAALGVLWMALLSVFVALYLRLVGSRERP